MIKTIYYEDTSPNSWITKLDTKDITPVLTIERFGKDKYMILRVSWGKGEDMFERSVTFHVGKRFVKSVQEFLGDEKPTHLPDESCTN